MIQIKVIKCHKRKWMSKICCSSTGSDRITHLEQIYQAYSEKLQTGLQLDC